jgi:hypothetical protein
MVCSSCKFVLKRAFEVFVAEWSSVFFAKIKFEKEKIQTH